MNQMNIRLLRVDYIPKLANFDNFTEKDCNDTKENKQKTEIKTKFLNTKIRVLQKNIIILHLLVYSTGKLFGYCKFFLRKE